MDCIRTAQGRRASAASLVSWRGGSILRSSTTIHTTLPGEADSPFPLPLLLRILHPMKPVICNYYLTYRCNARCGFCTIWQDRSVPASAEADISTVAANLSDVREAGVKIVDFTGGEPLLYERLPEALGQAKRLGLRTTITSNGIRYPERAAELRGLVDILQFSLDGPDAATHDAVKGVPSFDRVMESVKTARRIGERPTFIHTVTDAGLPMVADVIALARSMRVPLFLNPCFSYGDTPGISRAGARRLGELAAGGGVSIDRGFLRFVADGGNDPVEPSCLAVSSTIVISPDDKLMLPCFHFRTSALPIGGRLAEILASRPVELEKHRAGRYPFCHGCTVYCYMRASLFRRPNRYLLPSLTSAAKYLYEYFRAPRRSSSRTESEPPASSGPEIS